MSLPSPTHGALRAAVRIQGDDEITFTMNGTKTLHGLADLIDNYTAAPLLLAALKNLTVTARTFRNVPKAEQEWTTLDDEALEAAFAAIDRAEGRG